MFIGATQTAAEVEDGVVIFQWAVGDSQLDIKVYPNVLPFVNSAFTAQAVHVRFCVLTGHG